MLVYYLTKEVHPTMYGNTLRWLALVLMLGLSTIGKDARAQALLPVPVSGSAQFFRGSGLPVPILRLGGPLGAGAAGAPNVTSPYVGGFQAPTTFIQETTGPAPRALVFTHGIFSRPAFPATIGFFQTNQAVFQMHTSIGMHFNTTLPPQSFRAGGRSGPPTVTVCPGTLPSVGLTSAQNPGCIGTEGAIQGLVRYQALANQFGGVHQFRLSGTQDIAANVDATASSGTRSIGLCGNALNPPGTNLPTNPPGTSVPPTHCVAVMFLENPNTGPGPMGAPFGFAGTVTNPPVPDNVLFIAASSGGLIQSGFPFTSAAVTNDGTSWGGPFTTGRVFASAPLAALGPKSFTITGSDARNSTGAGTISLVAGTLSTRQITGPSANRGYISLVVPEPSAFTAAGVAVVALWGVHGWVRRSRRDQTKAATTGGTSRGE